MPWPLIGAIAMKVGEIMLGSMQSGGEGESESESDGPARWMQDEEFSGMDYQSQKDIMDNYFDDEMAGPEFSDIPQSERRNIRSQFSNQFIGENRTGLNVPGNAELVAPQRGGYQTGDLGKESPWSVYNY